MSAVFHRAYRTSFGMFATCDRETYRKLKRIRHLAGFAEVERRRWDRSQRRLAHNRAFKRSRGGKLVREPVDVDRMIFAPFYELRPAAAPPPNQTPPLPADARPACETRFLRRLLEDYREAKRPRADAAQVRPMELSIAEIDAVLEQIEVWNLRR